MRSCRCNRRPLDARAGFTLLEVVVGLTLMASLLVGSLLAFSAHQKQLRLAESKLAAAAAADDLLDRLSGSTEGIPLRGRGNVRGTTWRWRTRPIGTAAPAGIQLDVIRFEIAESLANGSLRVLTTVDVVKPQP